MVSDPTTHALMGAAIERALGGRATVMSLVLPDHPHADEETAQRIARATIYADALIAVGSGTINDTSSWDQIREAITRIMRPAFDLESILHRAGAPTLPGDLGWPAEFYAHAVSHARLIRNRYTFLDLAANCGMPASP